MRLRTLAFVLIAMLALIAIFTAGTFAASRCPFAPAQNACLPSAPIAATIAAAPEGRPCLLPWNCPNGKCRPQDVNVTVVAPDRKTDVSIAPVPALIEPAPERFPFGILLAVLMPVVLVASVIAFMIRMHPGSPS